MTPTPSRKLGKKMKSWSDVLVVVILFCLLFGCSRRRDLIVLPHANRDQSVSSPSNSELVVLLTDPDGKVGVVQVITKGGFQTLDKPEYATLVEDVSTPPTVPKPMTKSEITAVFGPALLAQPDLKGRFASFILYFESDTTNLTDEAKELLPKLVNTIRNRRTSEIFVVGHTDRVGTEVYNMELSSKRATTVLNLLVSSGIPSSALVASYHGETMPAVHTEDEVAEPRNRRVEVFVK
jgi:outer membrane protein OmpA-like peptidoglycan-associated protein